MRNVTLITLGAVTAIGAASIFFKANELRGKLRQLGRDHEEQCRALIRGEVERALDQINYARERLEGNLRLELQAQVDHAYAIAAGIHEKEKGTRPDAEIQASIAAALRDIRFLNGRGYFFISSLDGYAVLWPTHPEREGAYVWDVQDTNGQYLIREIVRIVRENGKGFHRYYMAKPGGAGDNYAKLAYMRLFEPYNWYIGTGEYIEDFGKETQQAVLTRLQLMKTRYANYLFGGTYSGTSLLGPGRGTNVLTASDRRVADVVRLLIGKAREGGGFVEYIMPSIGGQPSRPKISYVMPVKGWDWYIGAGMYVDDIDSGVALLQASFRREVLHHFYWMCALLLIVIGLTCILARHLSSRANSAIQDFEAFMGQASQDGIPVDPSRFEFAEFRSFAEAANSMLLTRRKVEQDLRRNEENLRVTLDSIGDAVIATDTDGRITRMNRVAERLTAWPSGEAEGRVLPDVFRIVDANTRETIPNPVANVLSSGRIVGLADNTILIGRDQREYRIADSGAPIRSSSGETIGVVLVFRDVTEEHALQEQLRESQKLDAIGRLAGGVAHDFNNMLGGIMGGTELLKMRLPDEPRTAKCLSMIMGAAERAADLADKLLAFSRRQARASTPIDVHAVIRDTAALLENTIDKRIRIDVELAAEASMVVGDSAQLQSVFLNLGINSSHAMPEGGVLSFSSKLTEISETYCCTSVFDLVPGPHVEIEVKDTGCGIPQEDLSQIFEPFFTTKQQGHGTGLGLAAAYGTVQQHKGAITVYSEEGTGTSFRLLFPLTEEAAAAVPQASGPIRGEGLILLVDDEVVMRSTGKALLEEYGYDVLVAENGRVAVELFREKATDIDLVVLDMIMPEMNGRDCFLALREIRPDAKIVLASGFTHSDDLEDLKAQGLAGYIQKPFRGADLSRIMSDAMAGG